jgi:hypothetical protein
VTWIKATNGVVIDIPESLVDYLVSQGHQAFNSEAEARGESEPKRSGTRAQLAKSQS